jgi:hypothetical protein
MRNGRSKTSNSLTPSGPNLEIDGASLHRAELQRLQFLFVLVERGVGIDLHLHLVAGVLLGEIFKHYGGLALGGVWRHHVAELDDDRRLGHGGAVKREAE